MISGSLRLRNGAYQARFRVNGERCEFSTGTTDRDEAEREAHRLYRRLFGSPLARFLRGRCNCDADTLGCGWLPGFCPHPMCRNWDWRMPSGALIERPLSQSEVAAALGVSRQRVQQIEAAALPRFVSRLHSDAALPLNWWRTILEVPQTDHDEFRLAKPEHKRGAPCQRCGRGMRIGRKCRCAERFAAKRAQHTEAA